MPQETTRPGRFFISERIWLNSRSRGSGEEAMGFTREACTQDSMIGNGKIGSDRDLERIKSWDNEGKADEGIGIHGYLWYKNKGS
jgi:hypothetical protein